MRGFLVSHLFLSPSYFYLLLFTPSPFLVFPFPLIAVLPCRFAVGSLHSALSCVSKVDEKVIFTIKMGGKYADFIHFVENIAKTLAKCLVCKKYLLLLQM